MMTSTSLYSTSFRTEAQAAAPRPLAVPTGNSDESVSDDAKALEAERKAKKMEEMRKRLEAFQAKAKNTRKPE